jgi:hypothetical protein
MRPGLLVGSTILVIVLSGCSGGKVAEASPSSGVPTGSAVFESDDLAGTIAGLVTDDEKAAIKAATVVLVELNLEVRTGDGGDFRFENVPLGTYKLSASKLGYTAGIKKVNLTEDGQELKADFLLEPIAIVEARHVTQTWNGKISCGILLVPVCGILDEFNQDYGTPNPTEEHWLFSWKYEGTDVPVAMVTEMD